MAATYPFNPSLTSTFQFRPVLDGTSYLCVVTWNLFAQRFYLNIITVQGALVLAIAMVGSPLDYDISLTAGIFTTQIVWRTSAGQIEVI